LAVDREVGVSTSIGPSQKVMSMISIPSKSREDSEETIFGELQTALSRHLAFPHKD
jgi:hypothetical protein